LSESGFVNGRSHERCSTDKSGISGAKYEKRAQLETSHETKNGMFRRELNKEIRNRKGGEETRHTEIEAKDRRERKKRNK
jgi:hypothetical protein